MGKRTWDALPPLRVDDDAPLVGERPQLFLGRYAQEDLDSRLAAHGFWDALARRGYPDARVALETQSGGHPRVRLLAGEADLGELRAHQDTFQERRVIVVDWIEARDPRASFTAERPRLPGQSAPGSGLGARLVALLASAAERTDAEGLLARPHYFHNAALYARAGFRFWDPAHEGALHALLRDLARVPLATASWAFEARRVQDAVTGAIVEWSSFASEQVLPVAPTLRARFEDDRYQRAVGEAAAARGFRLAAA